MEIKPIEHGYLGIQYYMRTSYLIGTIRLSMLYLIKLIILSEYYTTTLLLLNYPSLYRLYLWIYARKVYLQEIDILKEYYMLVDPY